MYLPMNCKANFMVFPFRNWLTAETAHGRIRTIDCFINRKPGVTFPFIAKLLQCIYINVINGFVSAAATQPTLQQLKLHQKNPLVKLPPFYTNAVWVKQFSGAAAPSSISFYTLSNNCPNIYNSLSSSSPNTHTDIHPFGHRVKALRALWPPNGSSQNHARIQFPF